mgnify:CR=1 FL=1
MASQPPLGDPTILAGWVPLVIGVAVSLDVAALTFCSPHIFRAKHSIWLKWAALNGLWHSFLLLSYLAIIDIFSVCIQLLIFVLTTLDIENYFAFLSEPYNWLVARFRTHIVLYAAVAGMAFVWSQYVGKISSTPTDPQDSDLPWYLRPLFGVIGFGYSPLRRMGLVGGSKRSFVTANLAACLVAVDMIALAAVIKSTDKLLEFPQGLDYSYASLTGVWAQIRNSFDADFAARTILVVALVFAVVSICCYFTILIAREFWKRLTEKEKLAHTDQAFLAVLAMRVLEPLVIFYFIMYSTAFIATKIPMHSPAFVIGSAFLVAALVMFVGIDVIIKASRSQAEYGSV